MKRYESPEMEVIVFDRSEMNTITDSSYTGGEESSNNINIIADIFRV